MCMTLGRWLWLVVCRRPSPGMQTTVPIAEEPGGTASVPGPGSQALTAATAIVHRLTLGILGFFGAFRRVSRPRVCATPRPIAVPTGRRARPAFDARQVLPGFGARRRIRVVETRDLRIFLAVVDENGMAAAGRRLGLSRTTITERVAALEKATGRPLFVRSPLMLTVAGRTLEPFARRTVREVEQALEEISGLATSRSPSGTLTVGLMAGGAAELNAPIFAGLHRVAPDLRVRFVHLSLAETEASVAQGRPVSEIINQ